MIPRRRRELQAGEQFSFASSKNSVQNYNTNNYAGDDGQLEYDTWAERIKGRNGYFGKSDDLKFGAWTRRGAFNYDVNDFRWLVNKEDEDSGTPSPPLWKDAGSPISKSAGNSPVSRAHQIEKFRQEMLEMVKDMPENGYELSLRDIVESPSPRLVRTEEQKLIKVSEQSVKAKEEKTKKKDRKKSGELIRRMSRNDSMEAGGGFLLKMVLPAVSVDRGARRKKKDSIGVSTSAKVSPRPSFSEAERNGGYSTDGEWWKKNELGGSGSSSSGSSNSSNSSTMNRIRKMTGCYSFLLRSKVRET